jgi:hypothetical protein
MPEPKSKFLDKILDDKGAGPEEGASFTKERQHTAQAFNLHVERRDGRCAEGFAWSHYMRYRWKDEGDKERLIVLFGAAGALEIEGHRLNILTNQIREGQLNGIRELVSRQATLLEHNNPDDQPVIMSVKSYPDFDDILREIKGEEDDDKHRHIKRVAGC